MPFTDISKLWKGLEENPRLKAIIDDLIHEVSNEIPNYESDNTQNRRYYCTNQLRNLNEAEKNYIRNYLQSLDAADEYYTYTMTLCFQDNNINPPTYWIDYCRKRK